MMTFPSSTSFFCYRRIATLVLLLNSVFPIQGFFQFSPQGRTSPNSSLERHPRAKLALYTQSKEQADISTLLEEEDDGDDYSQDVLEYDATFGSKTFRELYAGWLPDWLLDRCEANGWTHPTLIQQRVFKAAMKMEKKSNSNTPNNNSMVIQAQTGSGKTLTYLLPILAKLDERAAIQAMIVVPTRELGLQVATVAKRLLPPKLMAMSLLQGSMLKRQRAWAWAETPQVVIGTPKELLQMIQYGGLPRINSLNHVVVDEVDACLGQHSTFSSTASSAASATSEQTVTSSALHVLLSKYLSPTHNENNDDDGGLDDGYGISHANLPTTRHERRKQQKSRRVSSQRQTIFCSATIPQHRHFMKQCQANQWTLDQPLFISTSSPGQAVPPTLDHAYMVCLSKDKKLATLRRVLKKMQKANNNGNNNDAPGKILIFAEPSRPLEEMAMAIASDVEGMYFHEKKQEQILADGSSSSMPIVSVLRYEDSLSQRAGATNVFAAANEKDQSSSSLRIMLTTDLAARGLDIAGITHVVHFDIPPNAEAYLHRSGRTGRLGESGQVLSIITKDQEFVLERLSNALNLDTKCIGRQKRNSKRANES